MQFMSGSAMLSCQCLVSDGAMPLHAVLSHERIRGTSREWAKKKRREGSKSDTASADTARDRKRAEESLILWRQSRWEDGTKSVGRMGRVEYLRRRNATADRRTETMTAQTGTKSRKCGEAESVGLVKVPAASCRVAAVRCDAHLRTGRASPGQDLSDRRLDQPHLQADHTGSPWRCSTPAGLPSTFVPVFCAAGTGTPVVLPPGGEVPSFLACKVYGSLHCGCPSYHRSYSSRRLLFAPAA